MEQRSEQQVAAPLQSIAVGTVFPVLLSISFSHLLNDTIQSLIPSIYPLVKASFHLSFSQVGLITLTFQLAASLLQPFVGYYTDKKPQPFSLATGMSFTLAGLILLAFAQSFHWLLVSVAMIGIGSSVFHPEASKVAYMASGGRRGLAQSIFQVGGNAGSSMGPLLAALVVVRYGQSHIAWFSILALTAIVVLIRIGKWYQQNMHRIKPKAKGTVINFHPEIPRRTVGISIAILLVLIFSKYFYLACMSSYFTFFLIDKFKLSIQSSQVHLFLFLFSTAAGTFLGGPLGDKFGRKYVIWFSILGVAPFTILLPYMNLFWTTVFSICIGFILSSAFSAILVYAQELLPGKIGMVSGLFFGFAFGMGGLGSAVLGALADHTSIHYIFHLCGFLPLIGLLTGFLPDLKKKHHQIVS
jgi:MFS transporter, FSR family, fosmidomycin resistance protein